jgi:hypothetical protein
MLLVLRMGVQGSLYQDNSNEMRQLQEKILVETNFFDVCVLNYIFCPQTFYLFHSTELHENLKI